VSIETEQSQLERIEAKLDSLLDRIGQLEAAAAGFMSGPVIGKMFSALRNGKNEA
jgi:hypothetical protein